MKRFSLLLLAASISAGSVLAQSANAPHSRFVTSTTIRTFAGNGIEGFSGDTLLSKVAQLNAPADVATDTFGNVYIADWYNARVRKINTRGIITTIAGTGKVGYTGDAGQATIAKLNYPNRVAVDVWGNVYIADVFYNSIRKVDTTGVISTFAGIGKPGYSGDGEPAIFASLDYPSGIACDRKGNVFIADRLNNCIRKVDKDGIITTIAGIGDNGHAGDGGAATAASLFNPNGICLDDSGNLFVATADNYVRKIDKKGVITAVAGIGSTGYTGDGGPASMAALNNPMAVSCDATGNLFIADFDNHKVRMVCTSGVISTYAGMGKEGFGGDGGNALTAMLYNPSGLAADRKGNLYVSDNGNNRIRVVNSWSGMVVVNERKENVVTQPIYTPPPFNNLRNNSGGGYVPNTTGNYYIPPSTRSGSYSTPSAPRPNFNSGGGSGRKG